MGENGHAIDKILCRRSLGIKCTVSPGCKILEGTGLHEVRRTAMTTIKATVKGGRLDLPVPLDWPQRIEEPLRIKTLVILLVTSWILSLQMVEAASPTSAEMSEARRWAAVKFQGVPDAKPLEARQRAFGVEPFFSFTYGGKPSAEFLDKWDLKRAVRRLDAQRTEHTPYIFRPQDRLAGSLRRRREPRLPHGRVDAVLQEHQRPGHAYTLRHSGLGHGLGVEEFGRRSAASLQGG